MGNQIETEGISIEMKGLQPATSEFMTLRETARYLRISTSTLYKLTSAHRIPYSKPNGKLIYFLKADLDRYLLQNRIASESEIAETASRDARVPKKQKIKSTT